MGDEPTNEIPELYQFETLEQLRIVSDELRLAILTLVARQAMTVTQVAEALGHAPAKIHYHMRELERVGVVRIVETREKGGILEKYYRAIARNFTTDQSLFSQPSTREDGIQLVRDTLHQRVESLYQVLRTQIRETSQDEGTPSPQSPQSPPPPPDTTIVDAHQIWMTPDELKRVGEQITALFAPYDAPRGVPAECELTFTAFIYKTQNTDSDQAPHQPSAPGEQHDDSTE